VLSSTLTERQWPNVKLHVPESCLKKNLLFQTKPYELHQNMYIT
jgi:hypothetical protein